MEEAVIVLNQVKKRFGKFEALKDVSFTVNKGEILGFIGPNGAGKSTTIRVLLGMLKINSGEAKIFGQDVWKEDVAIHKGIAYVPGDVFLWPNLTGGEIIDLLLRLNQQQRSPETERLIKLFQLDTSKKARTYSKGNRQKVALIAALSQEADVYIFDEPTSGLDPLNEQAFQTEVLRLKESGKSVLLSSHILSEVEKMCDRIVVIREGSIIEQGNLTEMRHLTRLEITVETQEALRDLEECSWIHQLVLETDHRAHFFVEQDRLAETMTLLSKKMILSLQSTPPTLEDLFLSYYKDGSAQHE
ncbi:ABC transporter ATP-binding protein [Enterococcus florum]|uniref:ABC transporter ATP-binding protein n=1 Tax=Enterococcus florum TaxID=2480627 RepID=A0A4P5PGT6_9ENTE|nr:ABC transporter ATP-binding protein [Enterococcus florum]GCF95528.1 ABC transporter ATP-binding protein [Enterococcus florum]